LAFGAGFDALEHAAFHHEAHWLDKVPERRLPAWIAEALPGYQPGAPAVVDRVKRPLPCGGQFFWRGRDGSRDPRLWVCANEGQDAWRL
jgi:hypothetical protein